MTRRDNNPCKNCIVFARCKARFKQKPYSNTTVWDLMADCPHLFKYLNDQVEEEHGYGIGLVNQLLIPPNCGHISLDIPFSSRKIMMVYGRVLEEI